MGPLGLRGAGVIPGGLRGVLRDLGALLAVYLGGPVRAGSGRGRPGVAVVLGAQVLSGGRASSTLSARVRHAVGLYHEGSVEVLVPTGGLGKHPPTEAEVMARILREEGVPEDAIVLEDRATNTWESARLVAALDPDLWTSGVLVVTDPLHCLRTVAVFEKAGIKARAEPVYSSPMWRKRWSRRGQLMREAVALVWYRLRHGTGSPFRP